MIFLVKINCEKREVLHLRIIAGIVLGIWFLLVLSGKGGFVHILLLCGIGVLAVDLVTVYRGKMKQIIAPEK